MLEVEAMKEGRKHVRDRTTIGEAQHPSNSLFVSELFAVDTLATSSVELCEIATLDHEVGDCIAKKLEET